MDTLDLKLPYSDMTLLLDALRHYAKYIDHLDESSVDEDTLADLLNDNERVKAIESALSKAFSEKFGEY